jgi:hypothetical protein
MLSWLICRRLVGGGDGFRFLFLVEVCFLASLENGLRLDFV